MKNIVTMESLKLSSFTKSDQLNLIGLHGRPDLSAIVAREYGVDIKKFEDLIRNLRQGVTLRGLNQPMTQAVQSYLTLQKLTNRSEIKIGRFLQIRDSQGNVLPPGYLMGEDVSSIDLNDPNMKLILLGGDEKPDIIENGANPGGSV